MSPKVAEMQANQIVLPLCEYVGEVLTSNLSVTTTWAA